MSQGRLRVAMVLIGLLWLASARPSHAQESLSARISLNKTYYTPTDSMVADVSVTNGLGRQLTGTSTTLEIFPKLDRFMPLRDAPTDGIPLLRRTWYGSVAPGEVSQTLDRRLADLGVESGVYPVRAKVTSSEGFSAEAADYLVVLSDDRPKLPVVVMLGTAYPIQRDPEGLFVSERLARHLTVADGRSGSLAQIQESLRSHPQMQLTPVLSPQTLMSLQQMADGYKVRLSGRNGKGKEFTGGGSKEAAEFLRTTRELLKRPGAEAFFYPYGQASLARLEEARLSAGIPEQITQGYATVKRLFAEAKITGIATTDLSLGTTFLESLPKEASLALASASQVGADTSATPAPVAMSGENGRAVVLPIDDELSGLVSESSPVDLRAQLTAALAMRALYGENPPEHAVTLFLNRRGSLATSDSIRTVVDTLAELPWLATTSPSQAANTSQRRGKPSPNRPVAESKDIYVTKLRKVAAKLNTLAGNVPIVSEEVLALERQLLVSEDVFFVSASAQPGLGDAYLSWLEKRLRDIYAAVHVDKSHHITFSSAQGKIPIAIRNDNSFPLLADIVLDSKDAFQFDDKRRTVRLNPKDNLVTVNVHADFVGTRTLRADVKSGANELGTSDIEVTVNSYVRYAVVLAGVIVTVLMLAVTMSRRHRRT